MYISSLSYARPHARCKRCNVVKARVISIHLECMEGRETFMTSGWREYRFLVIGAGEPGIAN